MPPPCAPCKAAGVPQSVERWVCGRCSGSFCERHLHRGTVRRVFAAGGARLSFTYGHACPELGPALRIDRARPDRCRCAARHDLSGARALMLGPDGKWRCRACADRRKRAFYQREVAQARAAGLPVKRWRRQRAALRL